VTLYSALQARNREQVNICSVEDPLEIPIAGMNQTQINPRAGLTFHSVLRALLRQDPDIVMVGEIRDAETAEIALKAAQTGHLVLSTLHTNSTSETLTRLQQMGIARWMISSALSLVIAQRLVRKLCPTAGAMPAAPPTCRTACGPARCRAGRQRAANTVITGITAGWRCLRSCLSPRATPG
jgi:protein transport protein HofB